MKKILTIIALAVSLTASADDFSLYYDSTSGTKNTEVSAVANLQKIVFDNQGNMVIYMKNGTTETVSLSSVSRLFFSTPKTVSIKDVKGKSSGSFTSSDQIFDLTGRKVSVDSSSQLTPGIYIINGKKTLIK